MSHVRPTPSAAARAILTEHSLWPPLLAQQTEEFCRLQEHSNAVLVCTSLSDAEALDRVNLVPAAIGVDWRPNRVPEAQPRPCPDEPGTHRHMVFVFGDIEGEVSR